MTVLLSTVSFFAVWFSEMQFSFAPSLQLRENLLDWLVST
jgi:hypothetical protein